MKKTTIIAIVLSVLVLFAAAYAIARSVREAAGGSAPVVVPEGVPGGTVATSTTLRSKTWVWVSTQYNDGSEVRPAREGVFTITFSPEGGLSFTTDCNSMGGTYAADDHSITFYGIMSTLMYCEGSQESKFASMFTTTQPYQITPAGELILDLPFDSGSARFR